MGVPVATTTVLETSRWCSSSLVVARTKSFLWHLPHRTDREQRQSITSADNSPLRPLALLERSSHPSTTQSHLDRDSRVSAQSASTITSSSACTADWRDRATRGEVLIRGSTPFLSPSTRTELLPCLSSRYGNQPRAAHAILAARTACRLLHHRLAAALRPAAMPASAGVPAALSCLSPTCSERQSRHSCLLLLARCLFRSLLSLFLVLLSPCLTPSVTGRTPATSSRGNSYDRQRNASHSASAVPCPEPASDSSSFHSS